MIGASSGAGAPSTLPDSSAFGQLRFSQAIACSLLFEGSVFSTPSDLDFFLIGLLVSFSAVHGDLFGGRLFSFPLGGLRFVFAPPSVVLAFALPLAAGMASSAAARFKPGERFWS